MSSSAPSVWVDLVGWVKRLGGHVHPCLHLRDVDPSFENRSVFSTETIEQGSLLVRIPFTAVIHGQDMPGSYEIECERRKASAWLRCLAAYIKASRCNADVDDDGTHFQMYLQSLPKQYDTIWHWNDDELDTYLIGTTSPATGVAAATTENQNWKIDRENVRQRYCHQIRPYLQHCKIVDACQEIKQQEINEFETACQVLSTRGFHMTLDTNDNTSSIESSCGPYLIPVMDMLNHAPAVRKCTTLQRGPGQDFIMVAERTILAGEELLHSYDGDQMLSSSQFLASFGFVPEEAITRAAQYQPSKGPVTTHCAILLSKSQDIWNSCREVIQSNVPQDLARSMKERGLVDETWTVTEDRSRTANYVPENILISVDESVLKEDSKEIMNVDVSDLSMLTDELVTAACVPFLPECAYHEITDRTLINRSCLEDYFLGKLTGTALLKAVDKRLNSYTDVAAYIVQKLTTSRYLSSSKETKDDTIILQELLCEEKSESNKSDNDVSSQVRRRRRHLMYGLTIRTEEKSVLHTLRKQIMDVLDNLDIDKADDEENVRERVYLASKKQRR
jgi:hypothetical protein